MKNRRLSKGTHRSKKILLFIPILLIGLGIFQLASGRLLASTVECFTQYGPCPDHYLDELGWINGTPLLKPLPGEKIENSLKKYIEVKDINVYRRLPKTLVVSVLLRKPIGTLGPQVLGVRHSVDEEGLVLGESDSQTLPFLVSETGLSQGDQVSSDRVQALKLMGQVGQLTASPVSGHLNNHDLTIFLPDDQKVILNLSFLPSNWHATLQVILERSKIHSKIPAVIDLRFSDPIITF